MATIAENLKSISDSKAAIKTAIIAKGVAVSDSDAFATYANKISSITGGGGGDSDAAAAFTALAIDKQNAMNYAAVRNLTSLADYEFYKVQLTNVDMPNIQIIGDYTFAENTALTTLSMPTLKKIGKYTFQNCKNLKNFTFPALEEVNDYAFSGVPMPKMDATVFPALKTVSNNAFYDSDTFTSVDLPEVITVGNYGFFRCNGIQTVNLPKCTSIGTSALDQCYNITSINVPALMQITGPYAFAGNSKMTNINFPSLESTGEQMLNSTGVTSLSLPVCKTIKCGTFFKNDKIISVDMPEVTTVEESAFNNATAITSISLPKCTTVSGPYVFAAMSKLTSIDLPVLENTCQRMFNGTPGITDLTLLAVKSAGYIFCYQNAFIKNVNLPVATTIESNAFDSASALISVSAPNVTVINGSLTFNNCTALKEIHLPKLIATSKSCFNGCTSLTTVDMPSCSTVGSFSFSGCSKLANISLPNCTTVYDRGFFVTAQ